MPAKTKKRFYLDYGILIPYLILAITGVIMVYSASSYRLMSEGKSPAKDALMQAVFLIFSLLAILFIYKMRTSVFQNKRFIMFGMGVISVLLILTRFTSLGVELNGARGWLKVGPLGTIQPAEFLKIMIVWYLAYILSRRQEAIPKNFKEAMMQPLVIVAGLIALVLIQPDTGGAAILIMIATIMILASGISYVYAWIVGGGGVVLSFLIIQLIVGTKGKIFPTSFQHVYDRFAVFKNPFVDQYDKGMQMVNSYYAIYNGGLFGVGLGNSMQKKGFLPEAHSDFMFSIVIEELGLVVAVVLLLLLLFLILRIIMVGVKATSPFNSLICIGIGGMLLIQTFVNIGGITGIIPLTGVTFPFLSQGGSSLLTLSIGIGFVLNIRADELRKRYLRQAEIIELAEIREREGEA